MKIYIGSDHTGFELKKKLIEYLTGLGHEIKDMGANEYEEGDDYPDFIQPVAQVVAKEEGSFGIILGGSGQGEAMCANRVPGARAAVFYSEAVPTAPIDVEGAHSSDSFEIVKLARAHNNANILSLGVRFLSLDQIKFAIELFLATPFSGEERHIRRINKLDNPSA